MSQKFELINEFNNKKNKLDDNTPKNLIKYQEYEIIVDNNTQIIYIPLRECNNFEKNINELYTINKTILKELLYKHNGFRKRKQ